MKQYEFSGGEEIDGATEEELLSIFHDYDRLAQCVVDVKSYSVAEDASSMSAVVLHGIPPIQHKFNYVATLLFADGSYVKLEAVGKSNVGTVEVTVEANIEGCEIDWNVIVQVHGLLEVTFSSMISKYCENLIDGFFDKLVELL